MFRFFASRSCDGALLGSVVAGVMRVLLVVDVSLFDTLRCVGEIVLVLVKMGHLDTMLTHVLLDSRLGVLVLRVSMLIDVLRSIVEALWSCSSAGVKVDGEGVSGLVSNWSVGVVDVVADWVLGSLHSNQILVLAGAASKC